MNLNMQKLTLDVILEDVKNLISYSFTTQDAADSKFENLHKAIIKRYFDAKKVRINYTEQIVDLQLPVAKEKFTPITFECLDLGSFIQSCLKKDENSLYFYQTLLTHYNIVSAA